ncbi:MAG: hypothetical protein GF393_09205, partial [Armatimonadia bacterium]|nr:hypothetical protein [Armatimonadia bacterium]
GITEWWASGSAKRHMLEKHGVYWDEVEEVLEQNPDFRRMRDVRGERRYLAQGRTTDGRYLTVVFALAGPIARIVTAYDTPRRQRW